MASNELTIIKQHLAIAKLSLQLQIISNNHNKLKNQNNILNKKIKKLFLLHNNSFIKKDKEKNYKNEILHRLILEAFSHVRIKFAEPHHEMSKTNKMKYNSLNLKLINIYKWLIDEEFDLTIISECPYSWIIDDLKESKLFVPIYGEIFWNELKLLINKYLKYGPCIQ